MFLRKQADWWGLEYSIFYTKLVIIFFSYIEYNQKEVTQRGIPWIIKNISMEQIIRLLELELPSGMKNATQTIGA